MTKWEAAVIKDEEREENAQKNLARRIMFARRYEEKRIQSQYETDHSKGYCPICHTLRALNGSCSC